MNVNHVRLLALIVRRGELTIQQIIDLSKSTSKPTVMSRLQLLSRYRLVMSRREKRDADFIFYSASEAGMDLIRSLQDATNELDCERKKELVAQK